MSTHGRFLCWRFGAAVTAPSDGAAAAANEGTDLFILHIMRYVRAPHAQLLSREQDGYPRVSARIEFIGLKLRNIAAIVDLRVATTRAKVGRLFCNGTTTICAASCAVCFTSRVLPGKPPLCACQALTLSASDNETNVCRSRFWQYPIIQSSKHGERTAVSTRRLALLPAAAAAAPAHRRPANCG